VFQGKPHFVLGNAGSLSMPQTPTSARPMQNLTFPRTPGTPVMGSNPAQKFVIMQQPRPAMSVQSVQSAGATSIMKVLPGVQQSNITTPQSSNLPQATNIAGLTSSMNPSSVGQKIVVMSGSQPQVQVQVSSGEPNRTVFTTSTGDHISIVKSEPSNT